MFLLREEIPLCAATLLCSAELSDGHSPSLWPWPPPNQTTISPPIVSECPVELMVPVALKGCWGMKIKHSVFLCCCESSRGWGSQAPSGEHALEVFNQLAWVSLSLTHRVDLTNLAHSTEVSHRLLWVLWARGRYFQPYLWVETEV